MPAGAEPAPAEKVNARELSITYLLLPLGLIILIAGADALVRGSVDIAHRFNISEMAVGLTIVSFGTSLPEMIVSMVANLSGHTDLSVSSLLGSNISNVLLILGVAAIIRKLPVTDTTVLTEIPFSLSSVLLVGFLANAALFTTSTDLSISRIDGAILLFFFALFMAYVFKMARSGNQPDQDGVAPSRNLPLSLFLLAVGVTGLYLGGHWVVEGTIKITRSLGIGETMIGLTVVAIGTSLPELFASGIAAYRGKTDLAVGNVVGSNVFNLLWVLGATAVIADMPFDVVNNTDLAMVIFATTLVIVAIALGRKGTIERWHGAMFLLVYIAYLTFVISRGLGRA